MGSEGRFVYTASTIDGHPRSTWNMNNSYKSTIFHGSLVPVDITAVMPGDSFDVKISSLIRTATNPIFPIMDNIKAYFAAFFVPQRLLWDKTKNFYFEKTDGYGIQSEVLEPRDNVGTMMMAASDVATYPNSFAVAFGTVYYGTLDESKPKTPLNLNYFRSFLECYNDWFRNENFDAPYLWNHNETGDSGRFIATLSGSNVGAVSDLPKVCKNLDLFTACLPWTQKSTNPVSLPLGDRAVVKLIPASELTGEDGQDQSPSFVRRVGGTPPTYTDAEGGSVLSNGTNLVDTSDHVAFINPNGSLYADLKTATAATINSLRLAIATQRYFETLARCGSRYREYIKGMFGVNIGDTTAQMAEYLGGFSVDINVNQVVSSAGYSAGSSNEVGAVGAVSVTGASNHLFTKSFVEPGYVVICMYTKHNRTYGQGIDPFMLKQEIWDYYNPKFAFTGEVPVCKGRIRFTGMKDDDERTFGFNEYGNEYRTKPDVVRGLINPAVSNAYDFTNLAEDFQSEPILSAGFMKEDRKQIYRCLAGGQSSPDYFVDLYIERKVARPMPLYSIPGLMDHF